MSPNQSNKKEPNDLQKHLNTVLLSLCTTGVIWGASSINSLESRMARIETSTGIYNKFSSKTEENVNRNASWISDLQIRMSNVEILLKNKK